jgi:hypothetical protein
VLAVVISLVICECKEASASILIGSCHGIGEPILPLDREFAELQTHAKTIIPQWLTVNDAASELQLACPHSN